MPLPNAILALKQKLGALLRPQQPHWLQTPSPILRHIKADAPISVIDLGAHKGSFTMSLSRQYHIASGILVEPLPSLADGLRRDFPPPAYHVFNCAVSDREGIANFERTENEVSSSLLKIRKDMPELSGIAVANCASLRVPVRTLDAIVAEAGVGKIDLLKVDVQGAEDKVFAGAPETLARTAAIWVEVSYKPLYEGSPTFSDIYHQLDGDFRLVDMQPAFRDPQNEILQSDLLFLKR